MELKSPKAKKKFNISKLISWGRMFRTPLLVLFLLGTTSCKNDIDIKNKMAATNLEHVHLRHRHSIQPHANETLKNKLNDIKYLRRHLNREIVNFVMTDYLTDGEVENRVHFHGVTGKETYVGDNGRGLKLRQLTDGRHLVQIIYNQNGDIQDCEYITQSKSARNFLKTLRKELKQALDEEKNRLSEKYTRIDNENYFRSYENVSFRILKDGVPLPRDVADWLDYEKLRGDCLRRHQEMKYLLENIKENNSFIRFRACLKLADTPVSNMVGKIFFNIVQTKCFILKQVKSCTQRSWWGKCLRRGKIHQAFLRDNLPY